VKIKNLSSCNYFYNYIELFDLNMTFHKISIRNDVYQKLVKLKKKDESFSDLIDRLSRGVKGSWDALEELNGIAGPDELQMEAIRHQ